MKPDTTNKRASVLRCITEGMSIRATSRVLGVSTTTVLRVIEDCGEACNAYQDEHLRGLTCDFIQCDELFCFVGCREKSKRKAIGEHPGDVWCWVALCERTKLRITWHVGDRSTRSANGFIADLAKRVPSGVQITSDGLGSYRWPIGLHMPKAHYGRLIKVYGPDADGNEVVTDISKQPVQNDPMPEHISTSFIESSNLHLRMQNRRYARQTNAHSKKMANHCHMLAISFFHHNYCRVHMTLGETPAQAAGISNKRWSMEDVVRMTDRYFIDKMNREFEKAFATKYTPPRQHPLSYRPTPKDELATPWYLDMSRDKAPEDSGEDGKNL